MGFRVEAAVTAVSGFWSSDVISTMFVNSCGKAQAHNLSVKQSGS